MRPCLNEAQKSTFEKVGYLAIEDLLGRLEIEHYCRVYDRFLSGEIDVGRNRQDLGRKAGSPGAAENITQIMRPSDFLPSLREEVFHARAQTISRQLLGEDMDFDFDMLIDKPPHRNTPTPWHQDASYWLDMPDKRAVSFWLALDDAQVANGCMWFVPASNKVGLFPHRRAWGGTGAALELAADPTQFEPVAVPLKRGSCTLHHGHTLHYAGGNTTDTHRRALIVNYRPRAMIEFERRRGYDHT
jgi:phytanoyl-CoA hydroxylase